MSQMLNRMHKATLAVTTVRSSLTKRLHAASATRLRPEHDRGPQPEQPQSLRPRCYALKAGVPVRSIERAFRKRAPANGRVEREERAGTPAGARSSRQSQGFGC